jgi:hypothetical protein
MANGVSGELLSDIVADQMFAYGEATIGDDFHDDVLLSLYLMKREDVSPEAIYETIRNPDSLRHIAKGIGRLRNVCPLELLNASINQANIYRRRMCRRSPYAYQTYLKARDELYRIQASSLFISYLLGRGEIEKVRKELSGNYVKNAVKLGDKLGLIGQENAAIVFEATKPANMPEKKARETEDSLRLFYHGCTLMKQFTEDDSLKLKRDVEKRSDNLWVLLALQEYEDLSVESVKNYLKSNPRIAREVFDPCAQEIRDGYERLKSLGYDLSDLKLAVQLVHAQAKKDLRKFEKTYKISLDKEWLSQLDYIKI